ncbi:NUDIX domain-containing protein [Deinococcus piscis]|uniref:NUDIX domain-containing protein n=1 Tax=Deinococcus piscis TaxID=394230 RepID=UPI001E5154D0|nr:NUDIX domain-containing protein [Deinococcus piscis]
MITFYGTQAQARADAAARSLREKVLCFVVRERELLVFDHVPDGGAGVQVVAGGVEAAEAPEAAAVRELREESGLQLSKPQYLCSYLWEAQLPHRFTRIPTPLLRLIASPTNGSTTPTGICFPSTGPTSQTPSWTGRWMRHCLTSLDI